MSDGFASSFGSFLNGQPENKPAAPDTFADSFGAFMGDLEEAGRRNAKLNLFQSSTVNPDRAAKAQTLAKETGLPTDTVERNLPEVEGQVRAARQDRLLRDSPALVRWLQDSANARLAQDDFDRLGFFEKTWSTARRSYQEAALGNERARLGYEFLMGAGSPQSDTRLREINAELRRPRPGQDAIFQRIVSSTAGLIGGFADQLTSAPVVAATALGAGVGAAAGPGAAVTVPAGATAGFLGGLVADGFQVGAGQIWLALRDMRDAEGREVDQNVAIGASLVGGLLLGGLNMVGFKGAAEPVAAGAKALVRLAVEDAVKAPTARAALGQFGAGVLKSTATGGAFGLANEGVLLAAEQIARGLSDGSFGTVLDDPAERDAAKHRLMESMVDMALGFGALGVGGRGVGLVSDLGRARAAARDTAFLQSLTDAAADSATRRRAPDAFAEFVQQQAQGGPVDTLYVPASKIRELYQTYGLDPFELTDDADPILGFVPDRRRQLEQGLATGGDVAIPLGQYIAKLSGSELHSALKDDIRLRPDAMTAREAREFQDAYAGLLEERGATVREQAAAAADAAAPAQRVHDDVLKQARAAGYTLDTARQYASLFASRYEARASRMGSDAWSQYQRSGVRIVQVLPESLRSYTPDELDMMLADLKNPKRKTARDMLGATLLEFLSSKGGLKDVGGDLKAMDADKWHRDKPFRSKLIQEKGRGLDDAALSAFEAGYFPELVGRAERPTPDHLLAAIRDELAGTPRRVDDGQNIDAALIDRERALEDLDRILNEAGIDLRKSSIKEAKAALQRYESAADGPGYDQGRDPVARVKADTLAPVDADIKDLRKAAIDYYREKLQQTSVEHPQLGTIEFTGRGRRKMRFASANPDKLRLVPALPDILREGEVFSSEQSANSAKQDVVAYHRLIAPVEIDGRRMFAAVVVEQRSDGKLYYDHAAGNEEASLRAASTPGNETGTGNTGKALKQSVGTPPDGVNIELLQPDGMAGELRGRIRFEDGRSIISLFEKRDLSTFIHESGHLWLEEIAADARMEGAPAQVRDDMAALLRWFGVDDAASIRVEHHEQFARAFEAYAMEGKAPSAALGSVFQRFKAWLLSIYRTVAALRTPLNDEVRGVMDRLLATDEELAAARDQVGERRLFATAEQAGMTDAEFAGYSRAVERAKDTAETELLRKVMGDVRRQREEVWKAEAATVREEVMRELDRRPDMVALQFLRTGKVAGQAEGIDLPALKLSREALVQMYGSEAVVGLMPRAVPPLVVSRGGVHPDVVAETIGGFRTGREMVDALMALEDQQRQLRERGEKRGIRAWMIDEEVNRRMIDRHGDMLADGSIQEEALTAIHNNDALALHAVELRALGRRAGRQQEATPLAMARQWAASAIGDKTVRDVTVTGGFERAERQASRAVEAALLKGDYAEAFRQKEAQLLAAALYAEAKKASSDVDSGSRLLSRYAAADTLKAMDQAYLEQIHGLLERFDFRPASQRELGRRRSFAEWAAEQQANGVDVVAPASLVSDAFRSHYTEMTVAEFRGLVDSVKQIAHLGRLKKELIVNAERREFDAVVEETVARLAALPQRQPSDDINPTRGGRLPAVATVTGSFARRINAALLKMETVFEWLDRNELDGPFNRVVWEPIAKAQHERNDMLKQYTIDLVALRKGLDASTQRRMLDTVDTPELLNKESGRAYTMRLEEVAAIALNWGNAGNRDKLLKGYGWKEADVQAVLDRHMTADLWRFVQGTWDLIETLWPRIETLERKVNGVAPEKVERVEIETRHGKFAGGYYPVVYDPLKSFDAAERAARNADSLFENIYTRATTPKGFTKERAEGYARPMMLSLDVVPRHIAEVIHDVTHREAIMQADKFLSNREVMKAVEGALGREYVDQFRPWLQSIANEYAQDRRELAAWDAVSKSARMRATMVGLGFRMTTMMAQPLGLFDASEVVGARWVAAGLAEAYGSPSKWKAARDFVFERSGEVRNRMNETERDVRDAMRDLIGKGGWIADARRFAYYGIAMMDMGVTLPTWLGAYRKALHEGRAESDAISLADRAVRDSQGAASAKDLAAVQRGPEFMKLTTMFYSYFSHYYQRQATLVRDARQAGATDVPQLLARAFFLMVAPALGSALATGRGPKEDEDWGAWAARKVGLGLFNGIPMVRDVASMADNDLGGEYARGYQFTPIARLADTIWKTAKDGWNAATGDGASDRWVQHSLETAGYVFGLPLGQGGQTAQFLYNVADGAEQPDGLLEWLKGLTFGRTQDR